MHFRTFRRAPQARAKGQAPVPDIMRRFFSLIERFERPFRAGDRAAPEVKARITRFDDTGSRKPVP